MLTPVVIEALIKIAILLSGVMGAAAYLVLVDRWMASLQSPAPDA